MDALIICIGNEAHGDDGAGRHVAELLRGSLPDAVGLVSQPQLDVAMATDIAQVDFVIVVNAERRSEPPIKVEPVAPIGSRADAHALEPQALLALADTLYGARPRTLRVSVAAPQMEPAEGLSDTARTASEEAARVILDLLRGPIA